MKGNDILHSWSENAAEWINTLNQEAITSRKITNPAIVRILKKYRPSKVLDLGCGEGWLTRKLFEEGITTVGIDGTLELIENAKSRGGANFYVQSYEEIIEKGVIEEAPYEAVVFNFCLYLKDEVESMLPVVADNLIDRKLVFIQTLHPLAFLSSEMNYENQWVADSWKGLTGAFTSPHQWYYRTLEGWMNTFTNSRLSMLEISEPLLPDKSKPASIIFTLTAK